MEENNCDRCDDCGMIGEDVILRVDPYAEDILGIINYRFLCDNCYDNLLNDI